MGRHQSHPNVRLHFFYDVKLKNVMLEMRGHEELDCSDEISISLAAKTCTDPKAHFPNRHHARNVLYFNCVLRNCKCRFIHSFAQTDIC